MKPKKKVLLYCPDAYLVGMIDFALTYRVPTARIFSASTYEEVVQLATVHDFEGVIMYRAKKQGDFPPDEHQIWKLLETAAGRAKVVEVCNTFGPHPAGCPYSQVLGSFPESMPDIVECLYRAIARKRGPSGHQSGFYLAETGRAA